MDMKKQREKSWKDITLEKAMEMEKIKSDGLDQIIEVQAVLLGKTIEQVEAMTPAELTESIREWSFTKVLPKAKLTKDAKIGGRRYRMAELDKLSLAQMVDIEEYYNAGLKDNAHKIISVLMLPARRKAIKKWPFFAIECDSYEPSEERENDMLKLDMETVWGNLLFFSTIASQFTSGLLASLQATLEQMETEETSLSQQPEEERP